MGTVKKVPLRQCIGCRQMFPKKELLRVIKTPEDEILLDITGKKNGRGAYICKDALCLERVRKSKGLERALKTVISQDIYDTMRKELDVLGSK